MKKLFCMILALVMVFSCFSINALAADPEEETPVGEEVENERIIVPDGTRGISGYASQFVSTTSSGFFNVYVTGSAGLTGGLTFKTSCDESNYAYAYITIQRPNGSYILHDDVFEANEEYPLTFFFPVAGTYKVSYSVYVPSGATIQLQCWIY